MAASLRCVRRALPLLLLSAPVSTRRIIPTPVGGGKHLEAPIHVLHAPRGEGDHSELLGHRMSADVANRSAAVLLSVPSSSSLHNFSGGLLQASQNRTVQVQPSSTEEHHCPDIFDEAKDYIVAILLILTVFLALGCVCFTIGAKVKPRCPRYWQTWRPNPWSDSFAAEVDVTAKLLGPVQRLFDLTTKQELMGRGRDGEWATHKGLRVLKITRIEHGRLWSRYARNRENMKVVSKTLRHMEYEWRERTEKALFMIEESHAERMADPEVRQFLASLGLNAEKNERILFHGSPREGARSPTGEVLFPNMDCTPAYAIQKSGFDERLGSTTGMYGSGTYFADMAGKADQYAGRYSPPGTPTGSVGEKAVMFLSRVTLGCPYVTGQSLEQLRRPPCICGHFDLNLYWNEDVKIGTPWHAKGLPLRICDHRRFDSVVGDYVVDGRTRLYREYIVYDMQCYPEYMVEYERTA